MFLHYPYRSFSQKCIRLHVCIQRYMALQCKFLFSTTSLSVIYKQNRKFIHYSVDQLLQLFSVLFCMGVNMFCNYPDYKMIFSHFSYSVKDELIGEAEISSSLSKLKPNKRSLDVRKFSLYLKY